MNTSRRTTRLSGILLALAVTSVPFPAGAGQSDPATTQSVPLSDNAAWQGQVAVNTTVEIPAGLTLTILPGTTVLFAPGAGLQVLGVLRAEGSAERPIVFRAAAENAGAGSWDGIALRGAGESSSLRHCRVLGAREISIAGGGHGVEDCEITGGIRGLVIMGKEAGPLVARNRLADHREGGISCVNNSAPRILDNTIERCGPFGVSAANGSPAEIGGNTVTACESGIEIIRGEPLVRNNTIRRCGRGIALTYAGGGRPVQGNRLEGNEIGVYVQQFSAPEIRGNLITGGKQGVFCYMGASPVIRGNTIRGAEIGVHCNQMANALIEANLIADNGTGILLNLSSYATVRANTIVGNRVQMELGNMSLDWERRAGFKPSRGRQQQNLGRVQRGQDIPRESTADGFDMNTGLVDARGNWWGEETTREMTEKGEAANIGSLVDGNDVPMRTYEGYEGEYAQDRITFAPWSARPLGLPVVPPAISSDAGTTTP